jgi:4-hydroxy-4-methyl-2-oxoglutarate aldolase
VSGHRVVRAVTRPDADIVAGLASAGVSTVHEAQGRRGAFATAIRPIQDGACVAGPAVTVSCQAGDNLMLHAAVEVCRPGDIVVVVTTSPSTDGMLGELLATSLAAHGVVGVVMDAGVRDVSQLRAMRFPVWARAISPQGTVKASAGSVNVPVVCGGQPVSPGDVVVADDDGVVVVPRADAAEVLAAARAREASETTKRARLAGGELGVDMYDLRPLLAKLGVTYEDGTP